jgi:hypothetical protein
MGLLLLGIVHKGLLEIFFKHCPEESVQEFIIIFFYVVQPVIVLLDPFLSLLSSNASYKVGTLLKGVFGYRGVLVHNHKLFEGN